MRPPRARRVCAVLVLLWLFGHVARATASTPTVAVSIDPCVPVDRAALQRILTIELGTSTASHDAAAAPLAPTRVWIGCSPQGIELRLEDGFTSKVMTRALPAQSFKDPSSTRLLALAVAEFVVASWIELDVRPSPAVAPVPVAPAPSDSSLRAVTDAVHQRTPAATPIYASLSLGIGLQLFAVQDAVWLGGSLRFLHAPARWLAWSASLDLGTSRADVSVGEIDAVTFSASAAGLMHAGLGRLVLFTGPGVRAGVVRTDGASDDRSHALGLVVYAPYAGPLWLTRLEIAALERLRLAVEIEIGYVTLPAAVTLERRRIYSLDGLWGTGALSAALAF